jgi:hypothetical protein
VLVTGRIVGVTLSLSVVLACGCDRGVVPTGDGGSDGASADHGPAALKVSIVKAYAWANLMPVVPPDPTRATMTVRFTNSGSTTIGGIKLQEAAIVGASGSPVHPLTMKSTSPFGGQVEAGASASVDYRSVASTKSTPVPFKCDAGVKLRIRVAYSGGSVGPVESAQISFKCTH